MAELYLGLYKEKPFYTIVDDEYLEHFKQWKWRVHNDKGQGRKFYAVRNALSSEYPSNLASRPLLKLHRCVMEHHGYILPPGVVVDHINRNGLDNRIINLRVASSLQNSWNSDKPIKRIYTGVHEKDGRFYAVIQVKGKRIKSDHTYSTAEQAALAYNELAKKYHGRFARLNPVELKQLSFL